MTRKEKEVIKNCIFQLNNILIEDNRRVARLLELDMLKHPDKYDKRSGLLKRKRKKKLQSKTVKE